MHQTRIQTPIALKNGYTEKGLEFICPVCGGKLSTMNLPDAENVLEKLNCSVIRIFGSTFRVKYEFYHYYTESGYEFMDEFHPVVGVLELVFNSIGECIVFDILDVILCDT